MFEYLYTWIRNIAYYMVLVTTLIQVVPNHSYKKYIRFFTGLILILLIMTPVLKLFGTTQSVSSIYESQEYERRVREMEDAAKYLEDVDVAQYFPETYQNGEEVSEAGKETDALEIEEVHIGR